MLEILTDADKLPMFEDKYNALVTMQTSETSTAQLVGGASLRKSDYQKKKDQPQPPLKKKKKCRNCQADFITNKSFNICKSCYQEQVANCRHNDKAHGASSTGAASASGASVVATGLSKGNTFMRRYKTEEDGTR